MKKLILLIGCTVALFMSTAKPANAQSDLSAQIFSSTISHNIERNGVKGVLINVNFDVNGMQNYTGIVAARFYFSDGGKILDFNDNYNDGYGGAASYGEFTPAYDKASFKSYKLFMPYSEFHLNSGTHDIFMMVSIFCDEWVLAQTDYIKIRLVL